jgi:heme-degrading monooxygenase HmoA
MIQERAKLHITHGRADEFLTAFPKALPLFEGAKGCKGAWLERVVERTDEFVLVVNWETLDDHIVHFRQSPEFLEWRSIAGPFFAEPPQVEHVTHIQSAVVTTHSMPPGSQLRAGSPA